jgi:hypothetical protein
MARNDNSGFTFFVMVSPKQASYSFDSYFNLDGERVGITQGTDKATGEPIFKRFVFSRANRSLRIPNKDKETIEFLRNYPFCQDSENYTGGNIIFKELNSERDAEIALEARTLTNKAENLALSLKGEELRNTAVICGCDSDKPKIQLNAVVAYATSNPAKFLELVEDKDTTRLRSLLDQAQKLSIIQKKGFMFKMDQIILGNSEAAVVERLREDKTLQEALVSRLNAE